MLSFLLEEIEALFPEIRSPLSRSYEEVSPTRVWCHMLVYILSHIDFHRRNGEKIRGHTSTKPKKCKSFLERKE